MAPEAKCHAPEVHLLGEVAALFGNLELFVESSIWNLLAPEGSGKKGSREWQRFLMAQALTAEMSFDRKVHALASMIRQKHPTEHESELNELVRLLFDAQAERNALLHSAWNYSEDGVFLRTKASAKARNGLVRRFYAMPVEKLRATRDKIAEAQQALANFAIAYVQASNGHDDPGGGRTRR